METDYDRTTEFMDRLADILNPAHGYNMSGWKETEIVIKVHHKGIPNSELFKYLDDNIADNILKEMTERGHDVQIGSTNIRVVTAPFTVE